MSETLRGIAIAVADLPRTVAFYEALGFQRSGGGASMATLQEGEVRFLAVTPDVVKGIVGEEPGASGRGSGAFLLKQARSQEEVDAWFAKAEQAGAQVIRRPASNDWGGYSGAFADPDGHVWNVGFNLLFYRA